MGRIRPAPKLGPMFVCPGRDSKSVVALVPATLGLPPALNEHTSSVCVPTFHACGAVDVARLASSYEA